MALHTGKKGQPKAGQSGAKEEYTSATLKVVHHDESKLTVRAVAALHVGMA